MWALDAFHSLFLTDVAEAVKIPVLAGSGVTTTNVHEYAGANAIIIGSHLKTEDKWFNELEPTQVQSFMSRVMELRKKEVEEREKLEVSKGGIFSQGE